MRHGTPGAASLVGVMFINMLGFGIIIPLLPFYAASFNAAPWQIALIFSAVPIGSFFGEPFWGRLSDRLGRKPLLVSTVTGNLLCYLALAFAGDVWTAFAIRLVGGAASGNGAVMQGYIADVTPPGLRARRLSWIGAAASLGLVIGPFVGGVFANPGAGPAGFRVPLLIAAGFSGLALVSPLLFIREPVRHREERPHESRFAALGQLTRHPVIGRLMLLTFLVGFAFTGIESVLGLNNAAGAFARFAGPLTAGLAFANVSIDAPFAIAALIVAPVIALALSAAGRARSA